MEPEPQPEPKPDEVILRPMATGDASAVGTLAQAMGRNVHADEYARFFALEGARGVVLVRGERIIGAATAMRYYEHGFLGPVIVEQGDDAVGLAIALLAQLVEGLQREGVGSLDAEAGSLEEPILARMGFERVRGTLVMERDAAPAAGGPTTHPLQAHHLLDVGSLDVEIAGFGRKEFIVALARAFPEGVRVAERDGEVIGYVAMRRARRGYLLGPLATRADAFEEGARLAIDALRTAAGWPVVALVPDASPLRDLLEKEGFRHVAQLARMRAGPRPSPAGAGADVTEWAVGSRLTG